MPATDQDVRSPLEHTATATATGTRTRASTVTSISRTSTSTLGTSVLGGRRAVLTVRHAIVGAARWLAETVTSIGWLVLLLLVAGGIAGLLFGWSVGWMLGTAALVLILACVPFLLGAHDYRMQLQLERDHVVAGTDVGGTLEVGNAANRPALPGSVDVPIGDGLVAIRVPFLRAEGVHVEPLTIRAARRGVIDVGPMSVTRGDPIGIFRREMVWPDVQTLHVHPVTTLLPPTSFGLLHDLEGLPSATIVDSDLAFHAIRDYVPGDSRNHVHWKSTAKTGKLMVRQYEETRQSRIAAVLSTDLAGEYESDDEFELAVSVTASLGVQAVRDGRELIVVTGAEQPELARSDVIAVRDIPTHDLRTMLDGFSEVERSERTTRIEDVAALTSRTRDRLSLAFLVSGSEMPMARLRAAALAFGPDTAIVIIRCELDAEPTLRQAGALRVITLGALDDLARMLARGALA